MPLPQTIRKSIRPDIYSAVKQAPLGEVLSFSKLDKYQLKTVSANLRNRSKHGTYGQGVKIRCRSQYVHNGGNKYTVVLYVEKYQGDEK